MPFTPSTSSSSSTPSIPISTVRSKRDDDWYLKAKKQGVFERIMQGSFFHGRAARVLMGVGALLFVTFWLVNSSATSPPYPSLRNPIKQADKAGTGGSAASPPAAANNPLSCTKSYDGKRPVTQYVVMIDAGSSGSRVHVYEFNNCQATPQLMHEEFKMMKPGLSSFKEDAEGAAQSLDQLMDIAVKTVPEEYQSCTPVSVKATAGLRLLDDAKAGSSKKILDAVRTRLETKYPFPVVEGDGVSIMDGKDEGVYAWVTANYLLDNIGSSEKKSTAAVFDLGGGSTQIVFEPTFKVPNKVMQEGDHKYSLDFGGRHFDLYQHSHLGYGLEQAKKKINGLIVKNSLKADQRVDGASVVNPCLPPGVSSEASVELEGKQISVKMNGPKEPSAAQCRKLAEQILNKEAECHMEPCSFNGIHQPSFVDSFLPQSDMYIFSFFYDRTFPLGMPSSFSIDELKDLTNKVCKGDAAMDSFKAIDGAVNDLKQNPDWCMELSFMTAILHTGYDIPIHREVKIAKKIKNNELGWCLGASLPLLDQDGWKCKVKQV